MSATAFDAIEAAVVAALSAATAVSDRIETDEARVLATQFTDGIIVRVGSTSIEQADIFGGPMLCTTALEVELRKSGPVGQSAAKALGALLASANSRITADRTLGGIAMDTNLTGIDWQTAMGEKPAHACITTWSVLHQVSRTTLN